jgi:hypothetical protein
VKKSQPIIPPTKAFEDSWRSPHQQVLHPHTGPPRHVVMTAPKKRENKWQWWGSLQSLTTELSELSRRNQIWI